MSVAMIKIEQIQLLKATVLQITIVSTISTSDLNIYHWIINSRDLFKNTDSSRN